MSTITRRGDLIQRTPGGPWYLEARIKPAPGQSVKRHRISTGCTDYQDALRTGAKLKSDLLSNVHTWRQKAPTFRELWAEQYAAAQKAVLRTELSAHTLKAKRYAGDLANDVFGSMPLNLITKKHCEDFRDALFEAGLSKNTIRGRCSMIKAAFTYAVNHDKLIKNPWTGVELPEGNARKRVISPEEQAKLFDVLDARMNFHGGRCPRLAQELKNYFIVALGTALRINTVTRITRAHLQSLETSGYFDITTKGANGGVEHRVMALPEVVAALRSQTELRPGSERLFPLRTNGLYRRIVAIGVRAGIPPFSPHDLRRTALTRLAIGDRKRGIAPVPLPLLKRISGHKSTATLVKFYTVGEDQAVADALEGSAGVLLGTI